MHPQFDDYEWDESKRQLNLAKHGVDFNAAYDFQLHTAMTTSSVRRGETRYVSIGYLDERLHVIVYTLRGQQARIISIRRASRRERQIYVDESRHIQNDVC